MDTHNEEKFNLIMSDREIAGTTTADTEDLMFDTVNVKNDICYIDEYMVRTNLGGRTLAGEPLRYTFSRYGQLNIYLKGIQLKRQTKGHILKELFLEFFTIEDIKDLPHQWSIYKGVLFKDTSKPIPGKFLVRGSKVIAYFKPDAKVGRTIKFYEKKVYTNVSKNIYNTHHHRDWKPHVSNEVYDNQQPMFTREEELEEVREFITSLKGRQLGNEEVEILKDIASELANIL